MLENGIHMEVCCPASFSHSSLQTLHLRKHCLRQHPSIGTVQSSEDSALLCWRTAFTQGQSKVGSEPLRQLHMQGQATAGQQQAAWLRELAAGIEKGSPSNSGILKTALLSARDTLSSAHAAPEEKKAVSEAALELVNRLTRMQGAARGAISSPTEGLGQLPLQPAELQDLLADLAGKKAYDCSLTQQTLYTHWKRCWQPITTLHHVARRAQCSLQ